MNIGMIGAIALLWTTHVAEASNAQRRVSVRVQKETSNPPDSAAPRISIGLSAGASSGVGPSIALPIGHRHRVQLTTLPVVLSELSMWSVGMRAQHFVGSNSTGRLYMTEGVAVHHLNGETLSAAGVGFGVETHRNAETGKVIWLDLTLTAMALGGRAMLLPVPQSGVAWYF